MYKLHGNSQPERYAFFDVDDTLIAIKSMLSFQDYWYTRWPDPAGENAYREDLAQHMAPGACWAELNRLYYRHFAGRSVTRVEQTARDWYQVVSQTVPGFYHRRSVERLTQHRDQGIIPVFVSGSFTELLQPIALALQVEHILAINMEAVDGVYTGEILPPQTIGEGKAQAIERFLQHQGALADNCYAYGDDVSDLPMLQSVGYPVVITGGRSLADRPETSQWERLSPA